MNTYAATNTNVYKYKTKHTQRRTLRQRGGGNDQTKIFRAKQLFDGATVLGRQTGVMTADAVGEGLMQRVRFAEPPV